MTNLNISDVSPERVRPDAILNEMYQVVWQEGMPNNPFEPDPTQDDIAPSRLREFVHGHRNSLIVVVGGLVGLALGEAIDNDRLIGGGETALEVIIGAEFALASVRYTANAMFNSLKNTADKRVLKQTEIS